MKIRILFILSIILTLALIAPVVLFVPGDLRWWGVGAGCGLLIILAFIYRSIVKPLLVADCGMEMLSSQDFNVRLVKVGEPVADKIVDVFNDLMTRLKNERLRLREQDSFLRQLIDASPMGIIILGLDDNISMINPALRKIAELPSTSNPCGVKLKTLGKVLFDELNRIPAGKSEIIRIDGSRLFRGYHLWFMQDGFRRHFYLVESLTEEVRRAEKDAYEKVIRMISHEVNNTIGSVQTVLDIVAEDESNDTDLIATANSCSERIAQMCSFIGAFADLARIPEPVISEVDLNEQLSKMIPFVRVMVPESIELTYKPLGERTIVEVDRSQLQQVIINIIKNAAESFESTDTGTPFIRIETSREGETISLIISNNGKPISRDVATQLFRPFFTTKRSGRGLGLMLISEVLTRHGCSYTLRTDSDGITRFRILFKNAPG